ncbi:MAG: hypothetical protein PHC34_07405 [Candidatus Gastranaerophilales bacterium]|nr:hypothetical protein [Candidatus Gastranaerophilales bacterium]
MGLASSQARILQLVARKSDLEYRGQMINHKRLLIARDVEEVSKEYSEALNNRKIIFKSEAGKDISTLTGKFDGNTGLLKAAGITVWAKPTTAGADPTVQITTFTQESLEAGLRNGTYVIKHENILEDWNTDTSHFDDQYDKSDDAAAEATYQAASSKLQSEDKKLEMELKSVDTQHTAVQTEMDAVKKVIDKNIESSFKTFG